MSDEANDAKHLDALEALLHPVYLDVPMMISFLAALRGGVAFEDTFTRRDAQTAKRDVEAQAKIKLPSLGSLFGFDASGRVGRNQQDELSEEVQVVRRHTAASLFNALHAALHELGLVKRVEQASDLDEVVPGGLVEMSGEFIGNPLEPLTGFFKQAAPFFEIATEDPDVPDPEQVVEAVRQYRAEAHELDNRASKAERSGSPATRAQAMGLQQQAQTARERAEEATSVLKAAAEAAAATRAQNVGMRMLALVHDDLAASPVHDTVIKAADYQAVLTMSSEFFTDATRAHLRGGEFLAVGKVTRVLSNSADEINLLRRTVLGAMGPEAGSDLLKAVAAEGELKLEVFGPVIRAPAVQVLPLAVFI